MFLYHMESVVRVGAPGSGRNEELVFAVMVYNNLHGKGLSHVRI